MPVCVSLCLFHCLYCSLVWAFNLFAAGTETEEEPLPVAAQSVQAIFPCLLTPFVCSTFCCSATHTPPSHSYLTVQGSAGKTNINTTKSVSHTCSPLPANENQWILLRKLSHRVAYFSECGLKQTFAFHCIRQGAELHSGNRQDGRMNGRMNGRTDGRTRGPLTIINWPFAAVARGGSPRLPVVSHCNYFAVKQKTMAAINLIHTRAQLRRVTLHQPPSLNLSFALTRSAREGLLYPAWWAFNLFVACCLLASLSLSLALSEAVHCENVFTLPQKMLAESVIMSTHLRALPTGWRRSIKG